MELIDKIIQCDCSGIPDQLEKEIFQNIDLYKNIDLSEIYPNHHWVNVPELDGYFARKYNIRNSFYVISKIFHCLKTGSHALTYEYKGFIIKPLRITNHNWIFEKNDNFDCIYRCSECNLRGRYPFKLKIKPQTIIIPHVKGFLTCKEYIVKSIIE